MNEETKNPLPIILSDDEIPDTIIDEMTDGKGEDDE